MNLWGPLGLGSRIARRLLLWTLAAGLLGTLAVSVWRAQRDGEAHLAQVRAELEGLGRLVAPGLSQSLWQFDRKQVDLQLQALAATPTVTELALEAPGQPTLRIGTSVEAEHRVAHVQELVYVDAGQPRALGRLVLSHDSRAEGDEHRRRQLQTWAGNALALLLAALGAIALHHALVTRRVLALASRLRGITASELQRQAAVPQPEQPARARDELDELSASVDALVRTGAAALREASARDAQVRSLMEHLPDQVWMKDAEGRFVACNPSFATFYGRTPQDLVGQRDEAVCSAAMAEHFREQDQAVLRGAGPLVSQAWAPAPDGSRHFLETIKVAVPTSDGRPGVLGVARDMTAQFAAAEALREREALYHAIVSHAGDGIHVLDVQAMRLIEVNDAACRITGYTRDEYLNLPPRQLYADTTAMSSEDELRQSLADIAARGGMDLDGHYRCKDGRVIDVQRSVRSVRIGGRDCMVVIWRDVSAQKATQQALATAAAWHRALIDNTVEGIAIFDDQGLMIECNARFEQMLGYPPGSLIGQTPWAFDVAVSRHQLVEMMARGGDCITFETRHRRRDGSTYPAEVSLQQATIDGRGVRVSVVRDITARVGALEDLAAREEIYRSIVSQAGDGIVLVDPADGRFVEFNDAACALLGHERPALAELRLQELLVSAGSPPTLPVSVDALADQERQLRHREGHEVSVLVSQRAVQVRGRTLLAAIWHDISQRKASEAAARRERLLRETTVDAVPGVFFVIDDKDRLVLWNSEYERNSGYEPDQLAGSDVLAFYDEPIRTLHREALARCRREGLLVVESAMRHRDGSLTPAQFNARRVDVDGRVLVVGTGIDISRLKQAQHELQQFNRQLEERVRERTADLQALHSRLLDTQFAMDSVGIGITWADFETGRFIDVNRVNAEMLGHSVEALKQMSILDVDTQLTPERFRQGGQRLREAGHLQFETVVRTHDGRQLPVEISAFYLAPSAQAPARVISFMTDIRRRKDVERALREAMAAAEAANRAKSAFLANMSHEIRTPLNAITGMAYLIRRSGLAPREAERMGKLEAASEHLLGIIDAVLELSKIEAGKFALTRSPLRVQQVIGNVSAMVQDRALAKQLQLRSELGPMPAQLVGDATRLQQALLNYATNAIKFTNAGSVTLRARLVAEGPTEVTLRFEVEDSGVGIAPEDLARLFQAFEQADNSTTRNHGGTGLGLAITRKIAQLMGGDAGADSTPGVGSVFWFTARLERRDDEPASASGRDAGGASERTLLQRHAGRRALVVEDEPINREVAVQLLQDAGLDVSTAVDGQQAVEIARQQTFDLVLMDMQMPRLDGLAATRAIRQLPGWRAVPIVAMTANAFEDDRQACLAAGMSDFMSKPCEPRVLHATLERWLSPARA